MTGKPIPAPPLVLASRSASRRAMLDAAGVAYAVSPADIDESALKTVMSGEHPAFIAEALAKAKALALRTEGLVLGSDSLVECNGRMFDKPTDRIDAANHLRWFSGRLLNLHSAAALARDGQTIWSHAASAQLQLRPLSEEFIAHYLDAEWPAIAGCVGVFRIEGMGVQLFDRIDGDYFTILGMPLLALLAALRRFGQLPA
ncbi:Maf family protein [Croceicoccus sp. F390]|uniref:Nucleoside triphosphate pyrophosphatase n=1 Tax=Croceicoccus esteveae TaxID=3075597 RepID=A0ABU2ZKZ0_9SPHN|nr:Maf family protein [Croceicoccus sp. F390]MDT0576092.1 Maf family protein [Croceicoccus sp. F390]